MGATDSTRAPGSAAVRIVTAYFVETSPEVYEPTTDANTATHVLDHDGSGVLTLTAIGAATNPARMKKRGADYLIYGV